MNNLTSRNIWLAALVILLLLMVMLLRSRSPFGRNQTSFAARPVKEITKIEFTQGDSKLILAKDDDKWMVNGRYEAKKSNIIFMTSLLAGLKIKSPVSSELFQQEIDGKDIIPIRVRVFEGGRLLSSFLVYKTSSNIYGNIMKMRERSKPFIVFIPGEEDDIGSAFVVNELSWRSFIVFGLLPSEISSITFDNRSDPSKSFEIKYIDGNYSLSGTKEVLSEWDTSRVKRYVSYFAHVPMEKWAFDMPVPEKERIKTTGPCYIISVRRGDGSVISLSLWERYSEGSRDSNRLWGRRSDIEEFFLMRYFDADPIIKDISYFFTQ